MRREVWGGIYRVSSKRAVGLAFCARPIEPLCFTICLLLVVTSILCQVDPWSRPPSLEASFSLRAQRRMTVYGAWMCCLWGARLQLQRDGCFSVSFDWSALSLLVPTKLDGLSSLQRFLPLLCTMEGDNCATLLQWVVWFTLIWVS
jgi:hypothetical protein